MHNPQLATCNPQRVMTKMKKRYYILIALGIVVLAFVAPVIINQPWDRGSRASDLTGIDFPINQIYQTDVSDRGREWGFYIRVFELPDNVTELLDKNSVNMKEHPASKPGLESDHYTRITWTDDFPRNVVEENIFSFFRKSDTAVLSTLQGIKSDEDAINLANALIEDRDTLYAGWYKYGTRDESGNIWMPNFFFYLMNLEQKALIMFGLDT